MNPRVLAVDAQEIHGSLAVVTLVALVYICPGQHDETRAHLVPLEIDFVALEERLLRDSLVKVRHLKDLDESRLTLAVVSRLVVALSCPDMHTFRSGVKTATVCSEPGARAKSCTPSTRSLFQTVLRSSL